VTSGEPAESRLTGPSRWTQTLSIPSVHPHTVLFTALLASLVLFLFRGAILGGRVFFHRDVHLMWYTQVETFVRAVTAGEWPVWNPFIGFGQPLWADANTQVLYPPTWLNLLMRPWTYYTAYVVAHLLLAGAGLFALARRLRMGRPAAATAALVWVASGPLLSVVEMWNQLAGAAWMPWAGVAALATLHTGRRRWAVLWGVCQAAQVLSGALEAALMTATGVVLYAVVMRPWRDGGASPRHVFALGALALATTAGLSAVQWLPSLAVAARSARAHLPADTRSYWSVHPAALLQMWLPVPLAELHLSTPVRRALFEGRDPLFASLYLGLPSVALAGAAFVGRRRMPVLLAGGFLLAVVLALGRHTPAYEVLAAVPPLSALRYPVKAMLGAALCWALLVGAGFEAWAGPEPVARERWRAFVIVPVGLATVGCAALAVALAAAPDRLGPWFLASPAPSIPFRELLRDTVPSLAAAAGAGVVALCAAVRHDASSRWAPGLAILVGVLSVVPMAVWHERVSPTAPRDLYSVRPPLVATLSRPDHVRTYVYDYNVPGKSQRYLGRDFPYEIRRGLPGWDYSATEALAMRLALFPPVGGGWGIPGSFDRDTPGLAPGFLADLCDLLLLVEGTPAHLRLLQVGAVGEEVALHSAGLQALTPITTSDALMDDPVRVFGVPDPRPRAYTVSGVRVADGTSALRTLLDADFDPHREIVLPSGAPARPDPAFEGRAVITRLGTDRIALDAVLSAPGYVVLVDAYDPGWRAWVDGHETGVLRANVGFRAVAVEAGRHRLELRYRPRTLLAGIALTLASVVALTAGGAAWRSREGLS
jgi:Bacterial membrane protein YfhO